MPLIKRSSKSARATNIRRLIDEGYPPRQAVAIAYATQRAAKAHNHAGKPPKAPRPPAGTPTSGNLYVLHTELEDHEKRNGQPQPLNAFSATSMGAIRRLLKAGYLAPAAGYPRGYWVTTGQGDSALHEWRIRHAGVYGIPTNYGQNAAGGKQRKPSARSYAERLRSNADDFHHHRIDYETFSGRNKRIWSEVGAAGRATHEGVLKLLREEAGVGSKHRNRAGMADEDFKQRYGITTVRGVIYGRRDMLKSALSSARKSMLPVRLASGETVSLGSLPDLRERVSAYLDDDAFMRFRRGTIPARVADDIAGEISSRSFR